MKENKIDKIVNNIATEVTESQYMKKLFKFIIASVAGPVAGGITCAVTYELDGGKICLPLGWGVGIILFFVLLLKK